ncbi:tetratricopeptide repeat-containing sensor histidine kinase [Mucilaginibacter terrae]|uniref:histidine kinase n=1 Tax=Mucilaginibacter terrae TaxID=1955052 RepID=A0ABU3GQL3_9SPHI|nr:tetratricopeptide repeat protein [Mucilaginibacter terrae]MDT3402077.1 signal transduction histidine kinase [Mucilaginibacter terrae]
MPLLRFVLLILLVLNLTYGSVKAQPAASLPAVSHNNALTIADYDKLVKRYRYSKPDSATFFAKQAIALAQKTNDLNGYAMMLNHLGMIDDNLGEFDASKLKYMEALAMYRKKKNAVGEAAIIIRLGVVELRKGNYDKAIGYFLRSLEVAERSNNMPGKMEAYLTVAEGYVGQRKFDVALKYLNIAEGINQTIPFSNLSLNIYNNYGIIYRELGIDEKAKAYLEKGIALSDVPQYQGLNITLTNNLAKVYNKEGNKNKSIQLQKEALTKARKIQNYLREFQTLTGLGDTYGALNAKQAIYYFKQALELVREKGAHKQEIEVLSRLADLYKSQRNFEAALLMKEQQNALADSFFYKNMAKQVVSLQSDYELYKSNARVSALKLENTRQKLESKIYVGLSAACVLIIGVVGYNFYRSRKLNRLLNQANNSLEESNNVKDKLFSVLAHDLRTPFASVIDLMFLLEDEDIEPAERIMLVKKITAASNVSLETLNMLLKWGEMQLNGVRLNSMIVEPKQAIARVVDLITANADKKRITILDKVVDNMAITVDPNHFEFIVRNLLANAVKFTASGGVVIIDAEVSYKASEVIFSITDNGVGIKPERIARLFNVGNASTKGTHNETGTSLGLVMCKEFIDLNKGCIWVESEVNKGSTFYFALPLFKVTVPGLPVNLPDAKASSANI